MLDGPPESVRAKDALCDSLVQVLKDQTVPHRASGALLSRFAQDPVTFTGEDFRKVLYHSDRLRSSQGGLHARSRIVAVYLLVAFGE